MSTATGPLELEQPAPGGVSPWIIAPAVMLGTFMEVLDTTIVNVSLPHIAGSMAADLDESTWVLTSYLVSNAIVLPASGWFALRFGRKRILTFCTALFTLSSLACGSAHSLWMLILFRVLQGLGGGALQPLSQAILLESFPRRLHGMANAVYGVGVVIAPIIGPTLGGWLTDEYSWRWCFYINLPVGFLSILMIQSFVFDPPYIRQSRPPRADFVGLGLIAVGLGTLQVVLDKGQREDWFQSAWLTKFAVVSAVALVALVIWELRAAHPIINFRALRDRNLSVGTLMMFGLGLALYSSVVLYPILLQSLIGYTALLSGLVLSPGGIATLICMPISGALIGRVDPRRMIVFGLLTAAGSLFLMTRFNVQADFQTFVWPRVVFGVGLAFLFVPLATTTFAFIPRPEMGNATGIYNLMRNIGGSAGIALVTTLLARRAQFHQSVLVAHASAYNPGFQIATQNASALVSTLSPRWPVVTPPNPLGFIYGQVLQQANMLAIIDVCWLLGTITAVLTLGVLLLKRPAHGAAAAGAH